jgi:hypothetical protein
LRKDLDQNLPLYQSRQRNLRLLFFWRIHDKFNLNTPLKQAMAFEDILQWLYKQVATSLWSGDGT